MQQSIGAYDIVTELWLPLLVAAVGGAAVALVVWAWGDRMAAVASRVPRPNLLAWAALGALVVGYLSVIGRLSVQRHDAFKSHAYDLGIFTQVVWNTSQGRWFQNTVMIEHAENLLGQHFAPIFLALAPLYWVWPDPRVLLIVQSLALALGAVPVFLFARRRLGSAGMALALAAAYLLLPALHYINFYDFHEIALTTPLLLCA
ncbi:MAG: DUF2079 domain-containing protein, partial [Dehalococcoidia bacterium]|nr:DUF2079 domain-containing protein [Dehalococcoidia bacterium]